MAHKKAGSSTNYGRDSRPKYLGVKVYGGQKVNAGGVIIRQRGTAFAAGKNTRRAGDDTIYATTSGTVKFQKKQVQKFTGNLKKSKIVSVVKLS